MDSSATETATRRNINIIINGQHFRAPESTMTGRELLALGDIPEGNQLFLEVPGPGDDQAIGVGESIELRSGMKFYDVPVGNFG